MGCL
jgi:hypothetical protein